MDAWEHMVANSTLDEADGDAWEHLMNPSGEGGGDDVLVPVENITVEAMRSSHIINIDDMDIQVDIESKHHIIEVDDDVVVRIENNNKEITNVCN